jgi:hypothetical protein
VPCASSLSDTAPELLTYSPIEAEAIIRRMPLKLPLVLAVVVAVFKDRADLVTENIGLRHQLSCLIHRGSRPKLRPADRVFWMLLSRYWNGWTRTLVIVKPATVLAWHRKGFKFFWRWKSRKRGPGRPRVSAEVRKLIAEMAEMNVGWGAPRIHGELLKLGIEISEITVSRHMPKPPAASGSRQRWATFVHNHLHETLAIDFAVVPAATFGIVYVFFVLSDDESFISTSPSIRPQSGLLSRWWKPAHSTRPVDS